MNEKFNLKLLYEKIVNADLKTGVKLTSVEKTELKKILNRQKLGLQGAFLNFTEKDEKIKKNYCFLQDKKGFENKQLNLKPNNNNLLIEGENYHALIALTQAQVKVDLIYIDPPYNTGGKFTYNDDIVDKNDSYKHSKWLSFMKKRLTIAKELLKDDGVIFVSVDDNEQAYLKVLMDEIFGEKNFDCMINWVSNKKGRQISNKLFAKSFEYILVYNKKANSTTIKIDREKMRKLMPCLYTNEDKILKDEFSEYLVQNFLHNTNIKKFNSKTRPKLFFPIYSDGKKISIKPFQKAFKIFPPKNKSDLQGVWRWSKETIEKDIKDLVLIKNNDKWLIKTKKRDLTYNLKNIFLSSKITTKTGTSELISLGLEDKFEFPKPVKLIKLILQSFKSDITILDFFAGSGTTGQATLELNEEDGGLRRFILINEKIDSEVKKNISEKVAYERLYRVIQGKGTKNQKINWQFSKDQKSLSNNSLRFLELQYVNKINGEFEEFENPKIKSLYKTEFNHELTIKDVFNHD